MILLEPLPDENLASLFARMARLNGYTDCCDFFGTLFEGHRVTSFVNFEINVPTFCEAVGNAYGAAEDVTRNLTNLYALLQLGDLALSGVRDIECGKRILTLGELTFVDTMALSYCRLCLQSDIARYGFSYWHRVHQLPATLCCPMHGDNLLRFTGKHSRLHVSFPLPGDELVQMNAHEKSSNTPHAIWSGIATMAENLFSDQTAPPDRGLIRDLLQDELRLRGLITATGRLRSDEFEKTFRLCFPSCPLNIDDSIRVLFTDPKLLLRGVIDENESRPFARLMLVHWFFGEWPVFKERCNWRSVLGEPLEKDLEREKADDVRLANAIDRETAIRNIHRQVCISYMIEEPNPSRFEFLKMYYRSFRWLLHRDRNWLNVQLPIPPRQVDQLELLF